MFGDEFVGAVVSRRYTAAAAARRASGWSFRDYGGGPNGIRYRNFCLRRERRNGKG